MSKVSVVINTLNEEKHIAAAISSVKKLADEIILVDMKSEDRTQEIAKNNGAKVYEFKRVGYVEPARNFAISKACGDWILILDADEEIPKTLSDYLAELSDNESGITYYRIPRKNIVFGKALKYSRWWPDYNIRFFKKGCVVWDDEIHSIPITSGNGADIEARDEYAILHHHYETVEQYVDRMNRYTSIQAQSKVEGGYKFNWVDLITMPSSELVSRLFAGQGYKDGLHGLALASLQSLSELVVYLKVWQYSKFQKKDIQVSELIETLKESQSNMNYWYADTLLKEVGGLQHRIKRKFKLQ